MNRDASSNGSGSLWVPAASRTYPRLGRDVTADVAVVGGGIVGLTTARLLQQRGRQVVLLESRQIGRQVTGGSSAKITSQHSLRYHQLQGTFGADIARAYAAANQWAVEEIARTVDDLDIDCSFERRPAYVFTADTGKRGAFEDEARVAAELGLPARLMETLPLPIPAVSAVVFDHQAQFDPYAYVAALAEDFVDSGGEIFETTRVTEVAERAPHVLTTVGGRVTAQDVVIATNLPIIDRGQYFARAVPRAHLVLAARVSSAADGMFISVDEPTRSMRWTERSDGLWLVLTGPRFPPGSQDTVRGFQDLEEFVRQYFPVESVDYRWWNEDYYSVDGMPYVGTVGPDTPRLYLATGFSGWGITNGTVAGRILADSITGVSNEWASAFDSNRPAIADGSPFASVGRVLKEGFSAAQDFLVGHLGAPGRTDFSALAAREGAVMEIGDEQVAVSRDADGALHAVSAICTHLGCVLAWNRAMQTWDCGCHGSCFTADGQVLRGPAVEDLESFAGRLGGVGADRQG